MKILSRLKNFANHLRELIAKQVAPHRDQKQSNEGWPDAPSPTASLASTLNHPGSTNCITQSSKAHRDLRRSLIKHSCAIHSSNHIPDNYSSSVFWVKTLQQSNHRWIYWNWRTWDSSATSTWACARRTRGYSPPPGDVLKSRRDKAKRMIDQWYENKDCTTHNDWRNPRPKVISHDRDDLPRPTKFGIDHNRP